MKQIVHGSHVCLESWSRSEVASPVSVFKVSVREEIERLDTPGEVSSMDSVKINAGSAVEQIHSIHIRMGIDVLDNFVHVLEVGIWILELEITTKRNQNIVGSDRGSSSSDLVCEIVASLLDIDIKQPWVILNWVSTPFKAESMEVAVVSVQHMRPDLRINSQRLRSSPHKLQVLCLISDVMVIILDSAKEKSIKSHLSKEGGLCCSMAKWINVPANSWPNAKFVVQE
mmetsp:Transcript_25734/g.36172  ORF Transcript_25734/g.36172 Transcript_25734/m.36172 type:complete len:228 (-) Transcript_25734:461-1144(-)